MLVFVLACFLLLLNARAEDRRQTPREIDAARYCVFDDARKDYDASHLLQCIDKLATDPAGRESASQTSGRSQWNGSAGRQISFEDVFTSLFSEDSSLPHQDISFPVHTASSHYQSNYPTISGGSSVLPPGFQLNLFDALSSISRHDDYKCIPRILCEMASGKLPGRSLGKQAFGFFEFLGRNTFTEWLTKIDVTGTSPLLNFGRAIILGYSNRGNSLACYRAFPKCPRDPSALVYYLNNYNGGFFRLFNRIQAGKYRDFAEARDDYLATATKERIADPSAKFFAKGKTRSEFNFPDYTQFRNNDKATNERILDNESSANDISRYIQKSKAIVKGPLASQDRIAFFPQVFARNPLF